MREVNRVRAILPKDKNQLIKRLNSQLKMRNLNV
jgi:hypothetical protein